MNNNILWANEIIKRSMCIWLALP